MKEALLTVFSRSEERRLTLKIALVNIYGSLVHDFVDHPSKFTCHCPSEVAPLALCFLKHHYGKEYENGWCEPLKISGG